MDELGFYDPLTVFQSFRDDIFRMLGKQFDSSLDCFGLGFSESATLSALEGTSFCVCDVNGFLFDMGSQRKPESLFQAKATAGVF